MKTEQTFRLLGKEPHIISLMLLSAFAAMDAILMTPALPQIAQYFHTTVGLTQLTVLRVFYLVSLSVSSMLET